jgi:integrase
MGHIEKRSRDKGTVWRVRYRTPSGRELSKSFRRKSDAEKFLSTVEADIARGDWVDPTLGRVQLDEWSQRWLASKRRIKPKTRAGYESLLASRILPTFGDLAINRIDREGVETWVTDMLDEGLSASRVKQAYLVLNAMIKAAVRQGYLARNVIEGIEMPRVVARERRFLTAGQIVELAESMPARYRAFVYVVAYGGLRFGEAVALRRRRCDLLHGRLEIAEGAVDVRGELVWGTPKTHQIGSVSLPRFVVNALEEHLERFVESDPNALVFTSEEGGPLRNGNFHARVWKPVVATTNVPSDVTPHELRHTCATLLIAQGADPKAIQSQMRHSTISVTFDVYGHLFPGHLNTVLDRLDDDHQQAVDDWRRSGEPG